MQIPYARILAGVALVVVTAAPVQATPKTDLKDSTGELTIAAEGRWRDQSSSHSIAATGFLGVKRAELFAQLYTDRKSAAGAATAWKTWRTGEGGEPTFTHDDQDPLRFTAHSSAAGTTDYVRALDGAGKAAVVWVRLSGEPGAAADAANALLDGAALGAVTAKETPAGGSKTGTGGKETGTGTAPEEVVDESRTQRDPDFRIQITLPPEFSIRKDVDLDGRRVLSAIGTIGTDSEAYVDVYLFDEYLRADAAGLWWMEKERVGWPQGVAVEGDHSSFTVEVRDETWTRHVRVILTDAGVVGVKIDAASQVEKAAVAALDSMLGSLKVLKPRVPEPAAPPAMKTMAGDRSVVQYALPDGAEPGAPDFLHEADVVEEHVQELLGDLAARDGRKSVLRVYPSEKDLAAALRPEGITDGRAAYWWVRDSVVLTHAGALAKPDSHAELRAELTRFAMQRRLGYRAPFWLEAGGAKLIGSSAHNKGRIDLLHPQIVGLVRDVAPNGMEHETVRWWTREDSADRPERDAVSWSFLYFFLYGGQTGVKWKDAFDEYVRQLAATGDPTEANKAFDFSRNVELAEDWKKWARRL
jgi:hypothetical protein